MITTSISTRARRLLAATAVAGGLLAAGLGAPAAQACLGGGCASYPSGPPTTPVTPPTSKDQCKDGGWQTFLDAQGNQAFKNQGDCISYVASQAQSGQGGDQGSLYPHNPG